MTPELLEKLIPIVADKGLADALTAYAQYERERLVTQIPNVSDLNGLGRLQGQLMVYQKLEQLPACIRDLVRDYNAKR